MTKQDISTYLFIYFGFYVTFNTVQVISRRTVGRAEKTSKVGLGTEPQPQRWEARVLPLCHCDPSFVHKVH